MYSALQGYGLLGSEFIIALLGVVPVLKIESKMYYDLSQNVL